jgi:hypothetical protein
VSPELAGLIRRMLSEWPQARGSAEQVAQALEQAEKTAGRKANRPIQKVRAGAPVESKEQPDSRRAAVAWLGWLTAAALGAALAVRGNAPGYVVPAQEPTQVADESSATDGGTTALADAARTARGEAVIPGSEQPNGVSAEIPKTPLPGQRLPPCKKPEIEIYGGCWGRLADARPPCGDNAYEWNKGCYWPSMVPRRPGTSQQP